MNIEDIRLTPEQIENLDETNCPTWGDIRRLYANAATDKAIEKIAEFAEDWCYMKCSDFSIKWGEFKDENGFQLSFHEALKKLAGG